MGSGSFRIAGPLQLHKLGRFGLCRVGGPISARHDHRGVTPGIVVRVLGRHPSCSKLSGAEGATVDLSVGAVS